jgi:hypothetical protein
VRLADETKAPKLENALLDVKLGSTAKALEQRFPTLHRHQLAMGEILYEACDQKDLVVFSFVAEPWSPEFVTSIMVRRAHDVGVCRAATGVLPDLGFAPITARTVRIGDPAAVVAAKYGKPDEETGGAVLWKLSLGTECGQVDGAIAVRQPHASWSRSYNSIAGASGRTSAANVAALTRHSGEHGVAQRPKQNSGN